MSRTRLKGIHCGNKDKSKPVRQLLVEVFGREVLANSSLSGPVPSTHKERGVVAKARLHPGKIADIISKLFIVSNYSAYTCHVTWTYIRNSLGTGNCYEYRRALLFLGLFFILQ